MSPRPSPRYGIAVFHALGDILNCTAILRQLKTDEPDCHITWFGSERYRAALEHNPWIDKLILLEGNPTELDACIPELRASHPWTRFFDIAPYRNYDKLPKGCLVDLVKAASGLRWTVPFVPVFRLTPTECEQARRYWAGLPEGPHILVETEFHSHQSPWNRRSVFQMLEVLAPLDPCFVFTAKQRPPFLDLLSKKHSKTVWCAEPFRLNAEFYNLCDAFIGVSSGISVLSLSDHCRTDVPSIEFVRGEHWSTAPAGRALERYHCFTETRFLEALEALAIRLRDQPIEPDLAPLPVFQRSETHERVPCPACYTGLAIPTRGADIVTCCTCQLVYLRNRPTAQLLEGSQQPSALEPPPNAAAMDQDPQWTDVQRSSFLKACRPWLPPNLQGLRVVEVGCGWGAFLHEARKQGMIPVGFEDHADPARFGREVLGLDIRSESFTESQIEESSVDVVAFIGTLEQLTDPRRHLEKAAYILKPGGLLAIRVPNFEGLGSHILQEHWPGLDRERSRTHFTPSTLRALVVQLGFHVEACTTSSEGLEALLPPEVLARWSSDGPLAEGKARLEALGHGETILLWARKQGSYKGRVKPLPRPTSLPREILWIRTDALGDALLSASMLPHLEEAYPQARITVVCQNHLRPFYEACPHVHAIISYNRARAYEDEAYRSELQAELQSLRADLCLNSVYSREVLGDLWVAASQAPKRIGHAGDDHNMSRQHHAQLDGIYTELLPSGEAHALELDRHRTFLQALGLEPPELFPRVWTTEEDERFADALFQAHDLPLDRTVALFAGAQFSTRIYGGYGEALRELVANRGLRILTLGTDPETALNQAILESLGSGHLNLCGRSTLRQAAAILKRCRLAIGAETGLAHMACAVGTPNVIVLGGGHFGRFMPYSPLTSCAILPLSCYLCDWNCPYDRPYCVKDLPAAVLAKAVEDALDQGASRIRLYAPSAWLPPSGAPPVLDLGPMLDTSRVQLVPVDAPSPPQASRPLQPVRSPRTTVVCAVWHRDPDRFELLKGHQACLDAQMNPVERIYVFDNGDTPPPDLKGRVLVHPTPLSLYEAWALAIQEVRTPYVMNLNLDDRLHPEAVAILEQVLDEGADLVGGEWEVCFSQAETDAPGRSREATTLPFDPAWPPKPGRSVRLGSGTGERGTLGPACAWRTSLHAEVGPYPSRFGDGTPVRIIGDSLWWRRVLEAGKVVKRLPILIGRYHSHPGDQAEFRHPADAEEAHYRTHGLA